MEIGLGTGGQALGIGAVQDEDAGAFGLHQGLQVHPLAGGAGHVGRGKDVVAQQADLVGDGLEHIRGAVGRFDQQHLVGRGDDAAAKLVFGHFQGQQAQANGIFERHVGMDAGSQLIVDGGGAAEHVREAAAQDALADGQDDLLGAVGAVEVAAIGVAGAGVSQGHRAIHHLAARLQDNGVVIADGIHGHLVRHIHRDAAQLVNEIFEGRKIDLGVVVNGHAQKSLDGFYGQAGAAIGHLVGLSEHVGGVDAAIIKAGDVDPQVAGDVEHAGRHGQRVEGEQDHGVGARRAIARFPIPEIQAHHQHGDPAGAIPGQGDGAGGSGGQRGGGGCALGVGGRGWVVYDGKAGQPGDIIGNPKIVRFGVGKIGKECRGNQKYDQEACFEQGGSLTHIGFTHGMGLSAAQSSPSKMAISTSLLGS